MRVLYRLLLIGLLVVDKTALSMMAALEKEAGKNKTNTSSAKNTSAPKSTPKTTSEAKTSSAKENPMASALDGADASSTKSSPKDDTQPAKAKSAKNTDAKSSDEASGSSATSSDTKNAKPTLEISDVHSSGLDTINVDSGGNWLEKRIWFKKGEQLFDEIRDEVKKAFDLRMEFVHEVNLIGQKIDEFYEHVSFEKGQVDEMLKSILDEVSQASFKRGGDLSSKERSLKLSIQNEQKQIEQVSAGIKKVNDFDDQVNKTMTQAVNIINDCRTLETKSWDNFKAIGNELDDKKARTLYYEIDNAYKNIQEKTKHLASTLLPYIKTKLIAPTEEAMSKVKSTVKSLDEKGIHLESLIKGDEQEDDKIIKEREEAKEKEVEQTWEKQQEEKAKEKQEAEQAAKKVKAEKKEKEEEQKWYYRFFMEFVALLKMLACLAMCKASSLFEFVLYYTKLLTCKLYSIAPGIFDAIGNFFGLIVYGFRYLFCLLRVWTCKLFGY